MTTLHKVILALVVSASPPDVAVAIYGSLPDVALFIAASPPDVAVAIYGSLPDVALFIAASPPDVRRGCASPHRLDFRMGCAPGSGSAPD